jgi:hypothetical protein
MAREGATAGACRKPLRAPRRRATSPPPAGMSERRIRGGPMSERKMTEAQRAYEARRAAKAGMSLEKWMVEKERRAREDATAAKAGPAEPEKPAKKPGFFARLLERAQKPL